MGAGEMTRRIDQHHDYQAEDQRDTDCPNRFAVLSVGDDRPAAGENESEGSEALGARAAR